MTAPLSVVTVERFDNVIQLTWVGAPPRPPVTHCSAPGMSAGEEPTSTRRRARREWAAIAGLLAAGILCAAFNSQITNLVHTLLGGAR